MKGILTGTAMLCALCTAASRGNDLSTPPPALLPLPSTTLEFSSPWEYSTQPPAHARQPLPPQMRPPAAHVPAQMLRPASTGGAPDAGMVMMPAHNTTFNNLSVIANHSHVTGGTTGPADDDLESAIKSPCDSGGCRPCCPTMFCCPHDPGWFAYGGGLIMSRDRPNPTFFSANSPNFEEQVMSGRSAVDDWSGGWEVGFGRTFCYGGALSLQYWTVNPLQAGAAVTGNLNTPINVSLLPDLGGNPVDSYFDGSPEHRLRRRDEIHNIEINVWSAPFVGGRPDVFTLRWLFGLRYFRFDESLIFGSVAGAGSQPGATGVWGADGGAHNAYYTVRVQNNLIGPQIGGLGTWQLWRGLGAFLMPKFGLYGNSMDQQQRLYTGDGAQGFNLVSNKDDVSFIGELDLGLMYQFGSNWFGFLGYRVVGVTGIALSDNQVPQFLNDFPEMQNIYSNGSLVLHGMMIGGGVTF